MSVGAQKARKVIEDLGISDVADLQYLNEICMERGVFVREGQLDGAEARLTLSDGSGDLKAVIVVKPNDRYETRTRFSIAHELGHFEIHRDLKSTISCSDSALNEWFGKQAHQQRETDANEFASELLMPGKFLKSEINFTKPSLTFIEEIASRFQVSFLAAARRLVDLTEEPCALVYYRKDQILFHLGSKCFKDQHYWIAPGKLDSNTFAYDAARDGKGTAKMSVVDASAWIDTSDMKDWQKEKIEDQTVLEQAFYFQNLDLGVSLIHLPAALIWN